MVRVLVRSSGVRRLLLKAALLKAFSFFFYGLTLASGWRLAGLAKLIRICLGLCLMFK